MFCKNCGKAIDDHAVICPHCGVMVENSLQPVERKNTISIVGFIFSFLIPIVGLICSILGIKKANECAGKGKGLAIAGVVISILNWIGGVILFSVMF